jgi:hypothetical protein
MYGIQPFVELFKINNIVFYIATFYDIHCPNKYDFLQPKLGGLLGQADQDADSMSNFYQVLIWLTYSSRTDR